MMLTDAVTFAHSVQHHELLSHRSLLVWDGCNDHAENLAQGHCQIQPGGPGKIFVFPVAKKKKIYFQFIL